MAARLRIAVLLAITTSSAAMAQSGPPVLTLPPVGMVPARSGGSLPPGYGTSTAGPPVLAPQAPVVTSTTVQQMPAQMAPAQATTTQPAMAQTTTVQTTTVQTPVTAPSGATDAQAKQSAEQKMNDNFMSALQGMMPLTPGQTRTTKIEAESRAREAARPTTAPKPIIRSISLTLRPGEMPPVIRTFVGNATTLTFADRTGAPWPVLGVTTGNPAAFKIDQIGPQGTSSSIIVTPLQQFSYSNNLIVTLVNSPVPIIFTLGAGGAEVDYRVDVSLKSRGPNATVELTGTTSLAPTNDAVMHAFVDGVPPPEARKMHSSRSDVEVWRIRDMMYVRTNLDLLSPAPLGEAPHISGVKVFSLIYTPVLILSTQSGDNVKARIEDRGGSK